MNVVKYLKSTNSYKIYCLQNLNKLCQIFKFETEGVLRIHFGT